MGIYNSLKEGHFRMIKPVNRIQVQLLYNTLVKGANFSSFLFKEFRKLFGIGNSKL